MKKRYPFKFLDAYTQEDKDIFFGRKDEITSLYEMVFQTDLILVYGASGTGKTSLIQCGLASKFQSHDWLDIYIRRGNNLNDSFDKAIKNAGGNEEDNKENLDWLDEDWAATEEETATTKVLSPLARSLKNIYLKHFKPIYLIFDQFEELYILGNKTEQETFIQTVQELLQVEQPVKLIISIREEYLGYLYEFEKAVPELLRKKLRVEPMNLDKVKSVVQNIGAYQQSNVRLKKGEESAIAEGIFEKIKGDDKKLSIPLPYLQVFLDKLYLELSHDPKREVEVEFSVAALDQMKDIDNVLRDFLDEQVANTATTLKQSTDTIWRILSPFVTLEGTKEPLSLAALQQRFNDLTVDLIEAVLKAFAKSRILRFTEEELLYEVAHDSLALQIHDRRSSEEIAILEVQRLIKSQMALKIEARAYLQEEQLQLVDLYYDKLVLKAAEEEYLKASREEVQRQKLEKQRRRRNIVIAVIIAFAALGLLTWYALDSRSEAIETLKELKLNRKINAAEELQLFGQNYLELNEKAAALEVFNAALDSLGQENQNLDLYKDIEEQIRQLQ